MLSFRLPVFPCGIFFGSTDNLHSPPHVIEINVMEYVEPCE